MIPIIDEPELRKVVTPEVAVRAVREAFRADGEGRTTVPAVINLMMPGSRGEFHVKTAAIAGVPYVAVKVASGFPGNADASLPTGSGLMCVFHASTGLPAALLFDNGFLTDIRTGAAGAVAADVLGRRRVETVGLLGTGLQGRHQLACLLAVRSVRRVVAWSPTSARRERYCAEMRRQWGLDVRSASEPEAVCREADILVTATPAREPIVRDAWLRPGVHVTALGSDSPGKQELDPGCLSRADLVVVDRLAQCAAFGELAGAVAAGRFDVGQVHAELGAVVAGRRPGRTGDDQITIADLTGVGFQDTAIAAAALAALGV